jgi:glyoxylase-like metal-dependent hydrolase (beta-lactamase superfamily II)
MHTDIPGVHAVPSSSNAFVIDGDEGVTLIDTGFAKRNPPVLNVLAAIGRSIEDVHTIAITHAHSDHTGNAAALRRASLASVVASRIETPAIQGDEPVAPPPVFERFPVLRPFFRFVPDAEPVRVDEPVDESDATGLPADLTVVDTPGHTPGHVSFLLQRAGGVLFVGDAAVANRRGEVRRGLMNASTPTFDASLLHLAEYEFDAALFAHSKPIRSAASAAFRSFAATLG